MADFYDILNLFLQNAFVEEAPQPLNDPSSATNPDHTTSGNHDSIDADDAEAQRVTDYLYTVHHWEPITISTSHPITRSRSHTFPPGLTNPDPAWIQNSLSPSNTDVGRLYTSTLRVRTLIYGFLLTSVPSTHFSRSCAELYARASDLLELSFRLSRLFVSLHRGSLDRRVQLAFQGLGAALASVRLVAGIAGWRGALGVMLGAVEESEGGIGALRRDAREIAWEEEVAEEACGQCGGAAVVAWSLYVFWQVDGFFGLMEGGERWDLSGEEESEDEDGW